MTKTKNTKEKLIDATFHEIYTCGYNGASLANILKVAEVKKGAMYHYFPSKKDMVVATIEEKLQQCVEDKWSSLVDTPNNIIDKFILILQDKKGWDLERGCPLGNLLQEMYTNQTELANALSTVLDGWEELFIKILTIAQEKQEIRADVKVEETALFLISSVQGALLLGKKQHSNQLFTACMNQLSSYLNTLRSA